MDSRIAVDSATSRNALVLIAAVAVGAVMYWLQEILTPLALAAFLLLMIDGLARSLQRRLKAPPRLALPAALILTLAFFVGAIWAIIDGAAGFLDQLTGAPERLNVLIADLAGVIGLREAPTVQELVGQLRLQAYLGDFARAIQNVASDAFFVLVYLGFLLASRVAFKKKLRNLFATPKERAEAATVIDRVRGGVESFLWVQTVTGLMIAVAAWALMAAVGLQNAPFWAFVIFLVCYIPVIGGAVAGLAPPMFALVQFDSYLPAIILLVGLQLILFVVGNFVQPRMQGDDQNIDPVMILLSLAFWGAIWGVAGMFLSTPLTVTAIAILAEFKSTRWIAVLMSADGDPYPTKPTEESAKALARGETPSHGPESRSDDVTKP